MKRLFVAAVVLALLAYLGVRIHRKLTFRPAPSLKEIQKQEGIPVEVITLRPGDFSTFISATGTLGSEEEASVSA